MSTTPRGIQPKADQAKLLQGHPGGETDHEYKIIENTDEGRILQSAIEVLDEKLKEHEDRVTALENRGALAVLSDGNQVTDFASAYISDIEPTPPISGITEDAEIITAIEDGDLWIDTTDNVIKRYESGLWLIKGAAYL